MKKFLFGLMATGLLISCDKIEDPLKPVVFKGEDCTAQSDEAYITQQNVLIEEFTGVTCINCPEAATKIQNLLTEYPGQLYTIAIHAGTFAVPEPPKYPDDFRTDEGTEIFKDAGPLGIPVGLVNRTGYNTTSYNKSDDSWSGKVEEIVQTGEADIGILTEVTYDPDERKASVTAKFKALQDLSGKNLLWAAFLTESHVIAPQKMPDSSPNATYEHNHILRASFNGTWGSEIAEFEGAPDEVTCDSRSIILDEDWKPENCEIVVYIYERGDNTREILQVTAEHL